MNNSHSSAYRIPGLARVLFIGIVALLATAPAAQAAYLNVKNFGAKGDGRTDDTAAIKAALKATKGRSDPVLYFPAGVYRYSKMPVVDSVHVEGAGPDKTILEFTNNKRSAWRMTGKSPEMQNVTIRPAKAPTKRSTIGETAGIDVMDATDFLINKVHVNGTASAGILVRNSRGSSDAPARITACKVKKTLADGIHLTGGSRYIDVERNQVNNTGDDMIAVVSYRENRVLTHNINITDNDVADQSWGRGITVVGGADVRIEGNTIRRSNGAGIYLASEDYYNTFGTFRVRVIDNLLERCGSLNHGGHAGIMLTGRDSPRGQDNRVCDITVAGNRVRDSRKSGIWCDKYSTAVDLLDNVVERSRTSGIGMGPNAVKITLAGNRIEGAGTNGISVLPGCDRVSLLDDNSIGGANRINNCGDFGIEVRAEGGRGALKLIGAQISKINKKGLSRRQAININGRSSGYAITVNDNRLHHDSKDRFQKMILSEVPMRQHKRNATVLSGGKPVFVD